MTRPPHIDLSDIPEPILSLAREVRARGGAAYLVGGYVRDRLLGSASKDIDVEVFGIPPQELEAILSTLGEVIPVGRAFGVLRVKGLDVDFSVPRRDSQIGKGHRGIRADADPSMSPAAAVRRRDLTINALLLDPLTRELLDPSGGLEDLQARRLRAVDRHTFAEDPLRPMRVAQLAARLEYDVDPELLALSRGVDLEELPAERLWEEWVKMLLRGRRPSLGLSFLQAASLLGTTPQLANLVGVPQDPEWHPEGDVWDHTLLTVDAAAGLRTGQREDDLQLMFAALCHDLGKADTTEFRDGRWHSYRHDVAGMELTRGLLERLGAPGRLRQSVELLVHRHLQPAGFARQRATPRAYRRLAREVAAAGTRMDVLERVARADFLGSHPHRGIHTTFPEGDAFLRFATELQVREQALEDAVSGRHLIRRGLDPGPAFGRILARCRDVQDETGWDDPERILDRVLSNEAEDGPGRGPSFG